MATALVTAECRVGRILSTSLGTNSDLVDIGTILPVQLGQNETLEPIGTILTPIVGCPQVGDPETGIDGDVGTCTTGCSGNAWIQSGVDCNASAANFFSIRVGGDPLNTSCVNFSAATTGATLASQLSCVEDLDVAYLSDNGGTLSFVAGNTINQIVLTRPPTPGTQTVVLIADLDDALAASVTDFTLSIDGVPVSTTFVNFAAATDLVTLAAELDNAPGITVAPFSVSSLAVLATSPGDKVFSNISLSHLDPASHTSVSIFGLTDASAARVDSFTLQFNSTLLELTESDFIDVVDLESLAARLDLVPFVSVTTDGFVALNIVADVTGPQSFSNITLRDYTPATSTQAVVGDVTDELAAYVTATDRTEAVQRTLPGRKRWSDALL